jgi:hypothetical protein
LTACRQRVGHQLPEFLPLAATCPARGSVQITCSAAPTCGYSGEPIALSGVCNTTTAGAVVTYKVNGQPAVSAECPEPGSGLAVAASVEDYLGSCNYEGPSFTITCEQNGFGCSTSKP